ncbi:glutamate-gated chloride channel, partial [Aplysia californica]|uniref:Glutamate-gated chloride channel n=1 Tax=Aplysia californica TaxID=6500 RepID=A0ABM1VSM0_APLCA
MFPAVYVFISCLLVLGRSISAEDKLLRAILNESVYDVAIRPPGYPDPDGACVVEIDLLLNSVGPVSNMEMELTMSLYLRQEWIDPRLSYNETELLKSSIEISHRYLDRLWIPDLFFTLGKES